MKEKVTYALFGGSFDPPHLGHSEIVKSLLKLDGVDRVLVVPTFLNPFKSSYSVDGKKRLEWVKEVFDFKGVEISAYEIEQQRAVYTVETFRELSKKYNIKYIVIGADNLKSLSKWRDFEFLNSRVCWIVATRTGSNLDFSSLKEYKILNISLDVSSSDIRDGKSLEFIEEKIKSQVLLEYNILKK